MKKTTIELQAEPVAKLRAMLRALGSNKSAESYISEWIADTVEQEPRAGFLAECVHGDEWEAHPRRAEIEAELERCKAGSSQTGVSQVAAEA